MSMMSVPKALPDISKLEPLDGTNYKRWSQKLLIFLEQLEVDYVLFSDPSRDQPELKETPATPTTTPPTDKSKKADTQSKAKFEKDNKTVRGHILNHMSNTLFDLFINQKIAKDIWDILEKRYGGDDAGRKKYVVGKWLQFQMVDDKPMMDQVHEYENLVADVLSEGMKMCDILQANVLLEKFPPSWSNYRNHLKHKKKDITLQQLISYMRTEEANRLKDKQNSVSSFSIKANIVESAGPSFDRYKNKGKRFQNGDGKKRTNHIKGVGGIEKGKVTCFCCGKQGHKAHQCFQRKNVHKSQIKHLILIQHLMSILQRKKKLLLL